MGRMEARSHDLVLVYCPAGRRCDPDMHLQCQIHESDKVYVVHDLGRKPY